ncbi:unnamed protein product [Pocillopora meandrina]|uniref:Uncharacterized protein n=1 Tax=Pocillopora meandrina TaxID=46732 RepID=A0AAU9XNY5_9CNID|nr:unnamed protein product [Pocillopora meandrina]
MVLCLGSLKSKGHNGSWLEMGTSGEGTKFQCKLVGITDVASPEGMDMCAEAFGKLKKVKHMHPVKSITFVIPDPDDRKIFGYVFSQPDCSTGHKFYALKSENWNEHLDQAPEARAMGLTAD